MNDHIQIVDDVDCNSCQVENHWDTHWHDAVVLVVAKVHHVDVEQVVKVVVVILHVVDSLANLCDLMASDKVVVLYYDALHVLCLCENDPAKLMILEKEEV